MLTTWRDITHAMRLLLRTPGFTAVALLTLALGIGASTAVFTVVNALVLRPLPYPGADRLVMLWQDLRAQGGPADEWASPGNFVDWNTALLNDVELYDVERDPLEMNNLAVDAAKHRDLLEAVNAKLNALIDREVGEDVGQMLPANVDGGWVVTDAVYDV